MLCELTTRVRGMVSEWAPYAGLLSASTLIYWNMIKQYAPQWQLLERQYTTYLRGLGRSAWSIEHLPLSSLETLVGAVGGSLVVYSVATAGCDAGHASRRVTGAEVTSASAQDTEVGGSTDEDVVKTVCALLVAVRACAVMRCVHRLTGQLLVHVPERRQQIKDAGIADTVHCATLLQRIVMRLSQSLVMALALRQGVPYVSYKWLVPIICARICKVCTVCKV
jgi:hypothetical protein